MAALNIFKKKLKDAAKENKGSLQEKREEVKADKKERRLGDSHRILRFPHITEKASDLTKGNQYVFKVASDANKIEIRKAVENLYGVKALSVKIINIPRRRRRVGRTLGWRSGYKKAIVGVEKGQKIEIMPR